MPHTWAFQLLSSWTSIKRHSYESREGECRRISGSHREFISSQVGQRLSVETFHLNTESILTPCFSSTYPSSLLTPLNPQIRDWGLGQRGGKSRKQEACLGVKLPPGLRRQSRAVGVLEVWRTTSRIEVQFSCGVGFLIPSQPQAKRESTFKGDSLKVKECAYKRIKHTRTNIKTTLKGDNKMFIITFGLWVDR